MSAEDVLYKVYEDQSDFVMKRIVALDESFHEHESDCEFRCPKEHERNTLLDTLDNLGKTFEPYFRGGNSL